MTTIEDRAEKFADANYVTADCFDAAYHGYTKGATDQHEREMERLNDVLNALMIDTRDKCKILELMEK